MTMGFAWNGLAIRSGDNLALHGARPAGVAVQGAVIFRAGEPIEPPTTGPRPFITAVVPAGIDTANSGLIGMQVVVGAAPLVVTAIGLWAIPQNTAPTTIYLIDASWNVYGSVSVTTSAAPPGQFAYANLAAPYTMLPTRAYFFLLTGASAWLAASAVTTTGAAGVWAAVGISPQLADHSYGPVNFLYEPAG